MNLLIYILVYPLIWFISILPFRILYIISDILYLLIYYIIGYRKEVVMSNLKLVFPDKKEKELKIISKKFYSHFVDVFMEMIKTFTVSKEEIYKRYTFKNVELLNELNKDNKSVILMGPHYANWEWIMSLDSFTNCEGYAIFKKINNKYFNNLIIKSRAKFGTNLIETSKIISKMIDNHQNNVQSIYGLLSDQSPKLKKTYYWRTFLGVKVPIHTGAEMLAKKYNMNLVFIDTQKIKRGFYETSFSLISDDVNKYEDYKLTDIFTEKVEKKVREQPEYYLWTHNRFKHKDKVPN